MRSTECGISVIPHSVLRIRNMLEKNTLSLGLLIGLLLPLVAFAIFYGLYELLETIGAVSDVGFRPKFRERTCGILAIAMNAFALNFYSKRKYHNTVRGLVILTTVWVVVWLVVFGKHVL